MVERPIVSIIIPAFNEAEYLAKCLEAVNGLDAPKEQFEVIVVDNGSVDNTVAIAKSLGAQVFIRPGVNISVLRNFGAQMAKGDIFAFMDADCAVGKNWLKAALEELANQDVGAAGCNLKLGKDGTWVSRAWEFHRRSRDSACEVDWIQSGNLLIKRKCFETVKGFDDSLSVCEDSDICFRIKNKEYKIISNPAICSYHLRFADTPLSFFKKELWHGKDIVRVFLKSKNKRGYLKIISFTVFFLTNILIFIAFILSGHLKLAMLLFLFMILVSLISALRLSFEKNEFRYTIPLTVLFFIYGVSRAIAILDFRNYRK